MIFTEMANSTPSPSKIFLTGATGYLGGEVLHQLLSPTTPFSHPISVRALVRSPAKAQPIKAAYPSADLTFVEGGLDDSSLIEAEAQQADVVLNIAATAHAGAAKAILKGLNSRAGGMGGYYVQMGGASLFSGPDIKAGRWGEGSDEVWDDADVEAIRKVVQGRPERVVDNLLLGEEAKGERGGVQTALIIGPLIYGEGRGKGNSRSIQVPDLVRYVLQRGEGVVVGKGGAAWSSVHVADVASLIVALVRKAVRGEVWGQEGVYCVESGLLDFGSISHLVTQSAVKQGYLKSSEVRSVDKEEADQITSHGSVLLGTNARIRSSRAQRELGWKPVGKSLEDEIVEVVQKEAKALGLVAS